MPGRSEKSMRAIALLAVAGSIVSGFRVVPVSRYSSNVWCPAAWGGNSASCSRVARKMVLADVADVAKETGEDFTVADEEYRYEGEELPFEMIPKFERLKANYRGVMSALDEEDLSDVDDTYIKFESMLDAHKISFQKGEVLQGRVLQVDQEGALIDIGAKATAYMPRREVSLSEVESLEDEIEVDEEAEFMVISDQNDKGQVQVSIRRIQFEKAWEEVQQLQTSDAILEGPIVAVNRGGAIVLVKGLRGFLPGSHMSGGSPREDIIGKVVPFKFLEVNAEANKLVVSHRRAILEQEMKELSRGDVVEGEVKAIKPYGAFVEIRGMSGLLHISQISFDRVEDLPSILDIGMTVKCMIIDHDKVNGRIALSTKTLEPEPGDMIKNPQKVYEMAEETAAKYHERMEHERKAREDAAKSIVMGLGDGLDTFDSDVLAGIADGIESVLKAPPQRDE